MPADAEQAGSAGARGTCRLLTAPGRSAIATVLIEGDLATIDEHFCSVSGRRVREAEVNAVLFGTFGSNPAEDVVVCRIAADAVELHCHGGQAATGRILETMQREGLRYAPTDLTRAPESLEAEDQQTLLRAPTERTALEVLRLSDGRLQRLAAELQAMPLPQATAAIEAALQWREYGVHLTQPWRVVIFGRPNVGKSRLINRLVGYDRAIVYPQPGSTRDVVRGETALEGWPVTLSDTAGIRASTDFIESEGVRRARREVLEADLALCLLDASEPLTAEDHEILSLRHDAVVLLNKCDLPRACGEVPAAVHLSAETGAGLGELTDLIVRRLVPTVPPEDAVVPLTQRQAALLEEARRCVRDDDRAGVALALEMLVFGKLERS